MIALIGTALQLVLKIWGVISANAEQQDAAEKAFKTVLNSLEGQALALSRNRRELKRMREEMQDEIHQRK